jgi:PAS domain S-box-containing protein
MSDIRLNPPRASDLNGGSWQEAVEELRTAEEELRAQNEALMASTTELQAERERYRELFNVAPDCYLVTDPQGVIREANRAAAALFGRAVRFFGGKPLRVLVHPDHRRRFDRLILRLQEGEAARGEPIVVQRREGAPVPVAVHAHITRGAHGQIGGVLWLLHDLSDLNAAQDRALRAERLGGIGQTVAALAHESRNALQRGQACLRLLALEVQDRPKAVEYVERVEKAMDGLHRLFEDVRTITATLKMECQPCDLRALWREAWDQLEPVRQGRDCALCEDVVDADVTFVGDPFRLVQVFRNLFDNALAAAPDPARITVRAAADNRDGRPGLSIDVVDNGPGFAAEQRVTAFDPFYTTKRGSMGLGLALVRRIVEAHGGTVEVVDSAGGAVIRVTLPRGGGEMTHSTRTANDQSQTRVTLSPGDV